MEQDLYPPTGMVTASARKGEVEALTEDGRGRWSRACTLFSISFLPFTFLSFLHFPILALGGIKKCSLLGAAGFDKSALLHVCGSAVLLSRTFTGCSGVVGLKLRSP